MPSSVSGGDAVASTEAMSREPSDKIPRGASATTTSAEEDDASTSVAELPLTVKVPKPPPQMKVNALAPVKDILAAIPEEGIDIQELARKSKVDSTNFHLFFNILKKIAKIEVSTIVKPAEILPPESELEKLEIAAKKPPTPRVLTKNQVVWSRLLDPATVTWGDSEALIRGASNIMPEHLYRVFHEDSATLSAFMTKHNHVKSRDVPDLKLREGAAFQAIGLFSAKRDLTRPRIERHLVWNQKAQPSSFISAFNNMNDAKNRLNFHSRIGDKRIRQSKRIGERLALAVIETSDFVAMTVNADVEEKVITLMTTYVDLFRRVGERKPVDSEVITRNNIQIPIWVHKRVLEGREGKSSMTLEELEDAKPEIWLSITELRRCSLSVPATRGHHYEWLACGSIPLSSIKQVVPFDGKRLHWNSKKKIIRCSHGEHCWIWDDAKSRWVLDLEWERCQDNQRNGNVSKKALRDLEDENEPPECVADAVASDSDEDITEASDTDREQVSQNGKRGCDSQEVERMKKRIRLGNNESSTETVACTHQCNSWCRFGYTEQEAEYAMLWEAFASSSGLASNATLGAEDV